MFQIRSIIICVLYILPAFEPIISEYFWRGTNHIYQRIPVSKCIYANNKKNDCKNLSQDKECGIAVRGIVDPVHLFLFLATKSPLQLSYQQWLHHPLHRKASLNLMQMKLLLLSTIKKTNTTNSTKQRIEKLNSWLKDNKNVNNI